MTLMEKLCFEIINGQIVELHAKEGGVLPLRTFEEMRLSQRLAVLKKLGIPARFALLPRNP